MRPRIQQELKLLREVYPDIEHLEKDGEDWFRLVDYPFPSGWRLAEAPISQANVLFKLSAGYPMAEPYGFLTPAGVNFEGKTPSNTCSAPCAAFPGSWTQFSWAPEGTWTPSSEIERGSNLLSWVRSFAQRLKEGA